MYHRVLDRNELSDQIHAGMYVTREVFSQHLLQLSKNYQVVRMDELLEWMAGCREFSKPPCVISFDDGWGDNYSNAFPLLKKHKLPAHVFLATEMIGSAGYMTWDQVRKMEREGIVMGSHTATHAVLTALDEEQVRWELASSKETIEKQLGRSCLWFCYPKGEHNQFTYKLVQEFYSAALTVEHGVVSRGDDPFTIRRIGIHNGIARTHSLFACRLATLL
ncbi:MAG: polysaccharide deacetylase family protein [Nitrospiraceae bacterium]